MTKIKGNEKKQKNLCQRVYANKMYIENKILLLFKKKNNVGIFVYMTEKQQDKTEQEQEKTKERRNEKQYENKARKKNKQ